MSKGKIPQELQAWIDARKRHHLSHAHVQMARVLARAKNGGISVTMALSTAALP